MNPIHAAGVFRREGSGGIAAALTIEVRKDEQRRANNAVFNRRIPKGYSNLHHWCEPRNFEPLGAPSD